MTRFATEYGAWLALILAGFLPNEVWRWLGVVFSRGLNEDSEIVVWVRAVATAILGGVIAKLTIFAPGVLALTPMSVRVAALVIGFAAFVIVRRSVFAGVAAGELALVGGTLVFSG
ncbi:MAG: AzlD domain-containing protein [Alphaproteobacteria bacterium]|nr:AzlD domain-containing protein [Alphaproteobacteria bacterium]